MHHLKVINKIDPLKRNAEKQTEQEEFSPMDPPDAYEPPNMETVPYEELHPFLQQLTNEHKACIKELDAFEETLLHIQEKGLFPLLHLRLKEKGEHGHGPTPLTAVDMLEDDHIKALQLAAVVFNFFGLTMRLPDLNSRLVVLDAALEQGKVLIELLRLHIFREDNIVFSQAHHFLTTEELDEVEIQSID